MISILDEVPVSGDFVEHNFDARGECTWVSFETLDKVWVGVFGNGPMGKAATAAIEFFDKEHAFVLAEGQGYIVHKDKAVLLHKVEYAFLTQAVAVPGQNLIVAASLGGDLYLFDPHCVRGRSERFAIDDLTIEKVTAHEVSGVCWQSTGYEDFTKTIEELKSCIA